MDKFPDTCDRFIAYFDVMGFKDFSYRNSHEDVAKMMNLLSTQVQDIRDVEEELLNQEIETKVDLEKAIIMPVIFSDTIILISGSNTIYDARKSIISASFFLLKMMKNTVPVKGALAYGRLTADFTKSVYFGRPLIDAYLLSEETHFYGATLHHSFEKYLSENESVNIPNPILKQQKVPMKIGQVTLLHKSVRIHLLNQAIV